MMHHVKRIAKKKSVIALSSMLAIGAVAGVTLQDSAPPTRYVLGPVTRGALVISLAGSGQVSGQNQIDLKPSASGEMKAVLVKPGAEVKTGDPLFEIDQKEALKTVRDAAQSVRDAQLSVQSAQLSLNRLKQPPEATTLIQTENALNQAKRDLDKVKAGPDYLDIQQAEQEVRAQEENVRVSGDGVTPVMIRNEYDDMVTLLKQTSQTLDQAARDADEVLGIDNGRLNDSYERLLSVLDSGKLSDAIAAYPSAKQTAAALKSVADSLSGTAEDVTRIEGAVRQAQASIGLVEPLMQKVQDVLVSTVTSVSFSQSSLDTLRSRIQNDRTSIAARSTSLNSQSQAVDQAKKNYLTAVINLEKAKVALSELQQGPDIAEVLTAEERVRAAQASYDKVLKGSDPVDIAMAQNSLAQRESSLASARSRLADAQELLKGYTVRAPFDGVVVSIPVQKATQASPSTVLATLSTKAKIAEINLNEVDIAKVKASQKATVTFDAVPELTIAGTVSEVDDIGTVNQGVVTYGIKVLFMTDDERIKSGMSASVSIVTDIRQDTLLVLNSAVRNVGSGSMVEILPSVDPQKGNDPEGVISHDPPQSVSIQVGITNNQYTEVLDGLKEGDLVVTRTITPSASASSASGVNRNATGQGALRIPGAGGLGGAGGLQIRTR